MIYLLDTNAISDFMRENPQITARLRAAAGCDQVVIRIRSHAVRALSAGSALIWLLVGIFPPTV